MMLMRLEGRFAGHSHTRIQAHSTCCLGYVNRLGGQNFAYQPRYRGLNIHFHTLQPILHLAQATLPELL
jgi:hypothetical protein